MNDLLDLAVRAHGGASRWERFSRFRLTASVTGAIWAMKGRAGLLDNVVFTGDTRDQRLTISPFPGPGRYATWEPARQTIRQEDGVMLAEQIDPAGQFAGHTRQTPWNDFHAACFAAEATWNYAVAPFVFLRPGFLIEEGEPWREHGEVWRSLLVTYPGHLVAHCRQQRYFFDGTGLLRRIDHAVDVLGSGHAVHYPTHYRWFDGIQVPTRRRVYVRNPDGSPARESVSIAIDVSDAAFG
jgi:hypothetical protein